jgi:N6-L-threonylcarbamoyladenine synthase
VQSHDIAEEIEERKRLIKTNPDPAIQELLAITPQPTRDLLASFQYTVIEELLRHAASAAERMEEVRSLIVSGGVACNSGLRSAATQAALGIPVFFPAAALSTDNAVMIAAAAFPKFRRGEFADPSAAAEPNLALA